MYKSISFLTLAVLTISVYTTAQVIPADRRGDWTHAGYSDNQRYVPRFQETIFVATLGIVGDGITDNSGMLNNAIDVRNPESSPVTFVFPAGTYVFNSPIEIQNKSSIIIRGAGSDKTTFIFNCPCDYPIILPPFPECSFGDLIHIKSSNGCGIENLKVTKVGYPRDNANNILLEQCTGCWVFGVESFKPMMFHIEISGGSHNTIKGCYVHDAEYTGQHTMSHTHGYGINVSNYANHCVIEDNICRYLRHGIAFDGNAYDNVAGYNYVLQGHAVKFFGGYETYYHDWDILFHGSYNHHNLFEGNIVDLLGADERNGGPTHYNTFYRNIAYCSQNSLDDDVRFDQVHDLNLIGNVITKDNAIVETDNHNCANILDIYGYVDGIKKSHFEHLQVNLCGGWNDGRNICEALFTLPEYSYYYTDDQLSPGKIYKGESPDFWNSSLTWPPTGPRSTFTYRPSQKNPAKMRWETGGKLTVDAPPLSLPQLTISPGQYVESGSGGSYKVRWYNGTSEGGVFDGPSWNQACPYGQPITVEAVSPADAPFIYWSDGSRENPRVLKPKNSVTIYAIYKKIHKSNNAFAFSNNSQRKLVRTKDGWLHQVYESAGRVWLEHSTDNGASWFLGNNVQPLDNGAGKCPSIDWHYNYSAANDPIYYAIIVVFQQQSGSTYTIPYATFVNINGSYVRQSQQFPEPLYTEPAGGDQYATTNANPNIAWGIHYNFVLSFERKTTVGTMQPGIYWTFGSMWEYGGLQPDPSNPIPYPYYYGPVLLSGTNGNSTNATLHINKDRGFINYADFDIVYQQGTSSIMDVILYCMYNNGWQSGQYPYGALSSSTGLANYKPSMVQMPDANIRVCWIRDLNGNGSAPYNVNVVYWNSAAPSQYSIYGFLAQSVSLNVRDDNAKTFYAFSQNSMFGQWENYISNGTSYVKLNTAGRDVQLSNGPLSGTSSLMYVSSFYPFTPPYYFVNGGAVGGQLQKPASGQITYGRGIALNETGFFYSLRSLTVDKSNIRFAEIPEKNDSTTRRTGIQNVPLDSLNTMLISEPFTVGEGMSFAFSDDGGFTDSSAAIEVLGKKGYISCKLELIDDATGKTLGVMKESKFSSSSLSCGNLSASRLNLKGMGTKNVRVKITVSSNIDSLNGVWVNEHGTITDDALALLTVKELTLQSPGIIKEYALEQNYPNPFNPKTVISYQLPVASKVSLKVYDVLGREVATLVDGMKDAGAYSATFDGARLASGVYIMRLSATPEDGSPKGAGKPFVQVKKLMLLK